MTFLLVSLTLIILLLCSISLFAVAQLLEDDRRKEFIARNYTWPIPEGKVIPPTPGWDRLMRRRIRQVEALPAEPRDAKYDAWASTMAQAVVLPNLTQFGWAIVKAPDDLTAEIQQALRDGIDTAWEEHDVAIVGDSPPVMVDMPELIDKALQRLHPINEAWAGVPLKMIKGYGLRVYKNNSQLYMHLDKFATHIISSIYHIDHSDDSHPWPLVIEDLEGVTQKVHLEKGDILLYESAKCLHGRPIPFQGSWYTSLFLHYSPFDWPFAEKDADAAQFAIPDHWDEHRGYSSSTENEPEFGHLPELTIVDTAMYEGDCPNKWCGSERTNSWTGTAKRHVATTSHGIEQTLSVPVQLVDSEGDEL